MGINLSYIEGQTPIDEDEKSGLKIKTITTRNELDEWELHIYGDLDSNVQQYIESRNRISSTEETEFQFKTEPFSQMRWCPLYTTSCVDSPSPASA